MRGRDLQGVTSLLATHRVQDAFGLARYRFDEAANRVVARDGKGVRSLQAEEDDGSFPPTHVLVLRDGQIYFEGTTDDVLHSSDDYLKKFLASAE